MGRREYDTHADREHARKRAVDAEMDRLVREAITSLGGRVTPENLAIVPGRPGWPFDAKLVLYAVDREWHGLPYIEVIDATVSAKAMAFIEQFAFERIKCDNRSTAVIVIAEDLQ